MQLTINVIWCLKSYGNNNGISRTINSSWGHSMIDSNRVVTIHDSRATNWDFLNGWYGDYINQSIVDNMVDTGIMQLTQKINIVDAWKEVIPNYVIGDKIAIKVNFNDSQSYNETHNRIDALIHPINSIIKGLKLIGIVENDIIIFDPSRLIPLRFSNGSLYPGINYFDINGINGRQLCTFNSTDVSAYINFNTLYINTHKIIIEHK